MKRAIFIISVVVIVLAIVSSFSHSPNVEQAVIKIGHIIGGSALVFAFLAAVGAFIFSVRVNAEGKFLTAVLGTFPLVVLGFCVSGALSFTWLICLGLKCLFA